MYHLNKYEDAICQSLKKRQIWHLFFFQCIHTWLWLKTARFITSSTFLNPLQRKLKQKHADFHDINRIMDNVNKWYNNKRFSTRSIVLGSREREWEGGSWAVNPSLNKRRRDWPPRVTLPKRDCCAAKHVQVILIIGPAGTPPLAIVRLGAGAGTTLLVARPRLGPIPGVGAGSAVAGSRPGAGAGTAPAIAWPGAGTRAPPAAAAAIIAVGSVVARVLYAQLAAVKLATVQRVYRVFCVTLAEISDKPEATVLLGSVILGYVYIANFAVLLKQVLQIVNAGPVRQAVHL